MSNRLPIGIRANNPGNIRVSPNNNWKGRRAVRQEDGRFEEFETPVDGIRALVVNLTTYYDRHGLATIRDIIGRWAPSNGFDPTRSKSYSQNTEGYIKHVATLTGFSPTQRLSLHRYDNMRPLVEAIIRHENGPGPLGTVNAWYDDEVIDTAMARAGLPKPAAQVVAVPVTKETVGATATAGIGIGEIATSLPAVVEAMRSNEDHIASGSTVRVLFGVALVVLAGIVAWGQIKRSRQGVIQ